MSNDNSMWPVLSSYEGDHLREVAFPVGGIGTGTISLGGRAELRDFEICNRPDKGFSPPCTFFALRAQPAGQPAVTRVLEGGFKPPYRGSHGMMTEGTKLPRNPMLRAGTVGLPRMRDVRLDAAYPFARYTLGDPAVGLVVHLEAFNPFVPLDTDRSSLPVAILRYVLVNPGDEVVDAAIAGSVYNFMGRQRGADGTVRFLGGNVNDLREGVAGDGPPVSGLLMRSEQVRARTPEDGTMALVVLDGEATWKRTWGPARWNRHLAGFWEDFAADGQLEDGGEALSSKAGEGAVGSVAAMVLVEPQSTATVTFLLCWHFPHRTTGGCGWGSPDAGEGWGGNYYAGQYTDAWDVALQVARDLPELEEDSLRFTRSFVSSDLPQTVKEAALNNASTLRTQTCFRTANGYFYGFEGCWDDLGCCYGSCTHVWNYEQATPYLFPDLARSMREVELDQGTLENGLNCYRIALPLDREPTAHAAADGQMGVVIKCYREWQLDGDDEFLSLHWPTIRSLLEFCWLPGGWDADEDGVMEGAQHNTSDIEFFGPNPLSGVWYLGALRAGEEMAKAVGDEPFAAKCGDLFARGSAWIDEHLFNGEYYIQEIRAPERMSDIALGLVLGLGTTDQATPIFQVGNGCLADQLVGQYMAHVVGLGYLLQPEHVKAAIESVFRYNFRETLGDHWNNLRAFALADEGALLVCTWPHGDPPPEPFFRAPEVWTGVEYQAAAHMIYEGLIEEGLMVVDAVRARHDGNRRNPWDEPECGHHYARAMASWAVLLALNGFSYSAVSRRLELVPRWKPEAFRSVWTVPSGWGTDTQTLQGEGQQIQLEVLFGELSLDRLHLALSEAAEVQGTRVTLARQTVSAQAQQDGGTIDITLDRQLSVRPGSPLGIQIAYQQSQTQT